MTEGLFSDAKHRTGLGEIEMFLRQLVSTLLIVQMACGKEVISTRTKDNALKTVVDGSTSGNADSNGDDQLERIMRAIREGDEFLKKMRLSSRICG